jgi:hypothetical protein
VTATSLVETGTIHVLSRVINDNLGTKFPTDFTFYLKHWGTDVVGSPFIGAGNDRTVIVPTTDAILTLSTCYPFRFVGNAPKRYIVQAGLVIGEPVG